MDNCYLDALAVITFFKMSHKKHLFITGERGSGKSYLLNSILNQIEETMDMSDFFNYLVFFFQTRQAFVIGDFVIKHLINADIKFLGNFVNHNQIRNDSASFQI